VIKKPSSNLNTYVNNIASNITNNIKKDIKKPNTLYTNPEKKKITSATATQLLHKKKPSLNLTTTKTPSLQLTKSKKPINNKKFDVTKSTPAFRIKKCNCICNSCGADKRPELKSHDTKDTAELLYLLNDFMISTSNGDNTDKQSHIGLMKSLKSYIVTDTDGEGVDMTHSKITEIHNNSSFMMVK
jgi:hypothetical protein